MTQHRERPTRPGAPSPALLAWLFAPCGLLFVLYGVVIGMTGELQGKGGGRLTLGGPWRWMVGGFFMGIGGAISLTPLYYHLRRRGSARGASQPAHHADHGGTGAPRVGQSPVITTSWGELKPWQRRASLVVLAALAVFLLSLGTWARDVAGERRIFGAVGGASLGMASLAVVLGWHGRVGGAGKAILLSGLTAFTALVGCVLLVYALAPGWFGALMRWIHPILMGRGG
jgi:hypothetical protein